MYGGSDVRQGKDGRTDEQTDTYLLHSTSLSLFAYRSSSPSYETIHLLANLELLARGCSTNIKLIDRLNQPTTTPSSSSLPFISQGTSHTERKKRVQPYK